MFTVRGTKKFLDRVGRPMSDPPPTVPQSTTASLPQSTTASLPRSTTATTVLGDWYANVLFWRPQVALFVNAATFIPVLMPLAPAVQRPEGMARRGRIPARRVSRA